MSPLKVSILKRVGTLRRISNRFISAGSFATAQDVLRECGDLTTLTALKNGFRVASHNNGRQTATVGLWVDSGSQYENEENNGVARLWEHLIYSGTNKRSATQLRKDLARFGARLNSYTSRENSAYFVQCLTSDVENVVEILADVIRNTKLTEGKVEEYKKLILQELEESDSNYHQLVMDNLHTTAFQGTPMRFSPLGTTKSLTKISSTDVANFVDDCYKPLRMVLCGVGVDHDQLEKLAEKYFGDLSNEYKRVIPHKTPVRFTGSEFHFRNDDIPLMYGAVAVDGLPRNHIDYLPLEILNTAVGNWDRTHATSLNSPNALVQKLSPQNELISYQSFNHGYNTCGLFGYYIVSHGFDIADTTDLFYGIHREWRHFATGITPDDVERAKNKLKTNLFLALEDSTKIADHLSIEVLGSGKITPFDELEQKISYITCDAVKSAVMEHIYDRDIAIAGVGRTEAFPGYFHLRHGGNFNMANRVA